MAAIGVQKYIRRIKTENREEREYISLSNGHNDVIPSGVGTQVAEANFRGLLIWYKKKKVNLGMLMILSPADNHEISPPLFIPLW